MVRPTKSMPLYGALAVFVIVSGFLLYRGCKRNIVLAVGLTCILYPLSGGELVGSLLGGSLLALVAYFIQKPVEGFENAKDSKESKEVKETKEPFEDKETKTPPPDHGDRGEFFQLGKKYKLPSEEDDKEFHLDAGTTFMNAYKSLKPDQIAAMTKDTQELMDTQKQLMSTLQTLKPLITDGKQMMEMFQSYFGSGNPTSS
jgi:hypothetical protein